MGVSLTGLVKDGPTRSNVPRYMKHVDDFYGQITTQLHGELWKNGGPVIGVQLENEYSRKGPGAGQEHILALKQMAIAHGLDVPFYSVTGWDRAVVPAGAVLPVYGGYPDAPWDASLQPLPPNEVYLFRFGSRVAGNMGAIGSTATDKHATASRVDTPFITAEMGGGLEDTYRRRPVLSADDVAAMFPVMLGSGVNLYGSYMYHGGINPLDGRTTFEESKATGYPNDVPLASYDFQAPISSIGEERPLLRKLKLVNYFLNAYGADLATMTPHAPVRVPTSPADLSVPRAAVRSSGDHGFLFVNNHVRGVEMPARDGMQIEVKLPSGPMAFPTMPIDIPSGAYFIWPFNMDLGGVSLRYSTAQLLTQITVDEVPTYVFFCVNHVRCELSFKPTDDLRVDADTLTVGRSEDEWLVSHIAGSTNSWISFERANHLVARVLVLSQQQAENTWIAEISGVRQLLITDASFFADDEQITLESTKGPNFNFEVIPGLRKPLVASRALHISRTTSYLTRLHATALGVTPQLRLEQIKQAGEVRSPRMTTTVHGHTLEAVESPEETGMGAAAEWRLTVALRGPIEDVSNLLLRVRYTGDIAQLRNGERLLDDNFFNGQPWTVGVQPSSRPQTLSLRILPLDVASAIFLEPTLRQSLPAAGQVLKLDSVIPIPQYRLVIQTGSSHKQSH